MVVHAQRNPPLPLSGPFWLVLALFIRAVQPAASDIASCVAFSGTSVILEDLSRNWTSAGFLPIGKFYL